MYNFSKVQAIISDFDNTITHTTTIAAEVTSAVKHINNSNMIFTIATGRHGFGVMERVAENLALEYPMIVRGGAEIIDQRSKNLVWGSSISKSEVKPIYNYLDNNKIPYSIERGSYYHLLRCTLPKESPYLEGLTEVDHETIKAETPTKLIIRGYDQSKIDTLYEDLTQKFNNVHITKAYDKHEHYVIDITAHNASKHLATLEFLKMYDLNSKYVIGVGDNYNDYPLLTACGYKVATADAPTELKEIADEIIPTAKELGILKLLERFL